MLPWRRLGGAICFVAARMLALGCVLVSLHGGDDDSIGTTVARNSAHVIRPCGNAPAPAVGSFETQYIYMYV